MLLKRVKPENAAPATMKAGMRNSSAVKKPKVCPSSPTGSPSKAPVSQFPSRAGLLAKSFLGSSTTNKREGSASKQTQSQTSKSETTIEGKRIELKKRRPLGEKVVASQQTTVPPSRVGKQEDAISKARNIPRTFNKLVNKKAQSNVTKTQIPGPAPMVRLSQLIASPDDSSLNKETIYDTKRNNYSSNAKTTSTRPVSVTVDATKPQLYPSTRYPKMAPNKKEPSKSSNASASSSYCLKSSSEASAMGKQMVHDSSDYSSYSSPTTGIAKKQGDKKSSKQPAASHARQSTFQKSSSLVKEIVNKQDACVLPTSSSECGSPLLRFSKQEPQDNDRQSQPLLRKSKIPVIRKDNEPSLCSPVDHLLQSSPTAQSLQRKVSLNKANLNKEQESKSIKTRTTKSTNPIIRKDNEPSLCSPDNHLLQSSPAAQSLQRKVSLNKVNLNKEQGSKSIKTGPTKSPHPIVRKDKEPSLCSPDDHLLQSSPTAESLQRKVSLNKTNSKKEQGSKFIENQTTKSTNSIIRKDNEPTLCAPVDNLLPSSPITQSLQRKVSLNKANLNKEQGSKFIKAETTTCTKLLNNDTKSSGSSKVESNQSSGAPGVSNSKLATFNKSSEVESNCGSNTITSPNPLINESKISELSKGKHSSNLCPSTDDDVLSSPIAQSLQRKVSASITDSNCMQVPERIEEATAKFSEWANVQSNSLSAERGAPDQSLVEEFYDPEEEIYESEREPSSDDDATFEGVCNALKGFIAYTNANQLKEYESGTSSTWSADFTYFNMDDEYFESQVIEACMRVVFPHYFSFKVPELENVRFTVLLQQFFMTVKIFFVVCARGRIPCQFMSRTILLINRSIIHEFSDGQQLTAEFLQQCEYGIPGDYGLEICQLIVDLHNNYHPCSKYRFLSFLSVERFIYLEVYRFDYPKENIFKLLIPRMRYVAYFLAISPSFFELSPVLHGGIAYYITRASFFLECGVYEDLNPWIQDGLEDCEEMKDEFIRAEASKYLRKLSKKVKQELIEVIGPDTLELIESGCTYGEYLAMKGLLNRSSPSDPVENQCADAAVHEAGTTDEGAPETLNKRKTGEVDFDDQYLHDTAEATPDIDGANPRKRARHEIAPSTKAKRKVARKPKAIKKRLTRKTSKSNGDGSMNREIDGGLNREEILIPRKRKADDEDSTHLAEKKMKTSRKVVLK